MRPAATFFACPASDEELDVHAARGKQIKVVLDDLLLDPFLSLSLVHSPYSLLGSMKSGSGSFFCSLCLKCALIASSTSALEKNLLSTISRNSSAWNIEASCRRSSTYTLAIIMAILLLRVLFQIDVDGLSHVLGLELKESL